MITSVYVNALCIECRIDLNWAAKQTWRHLFKVFDELIEIKKPREKKQTKASVEQINQFIK